MNDNDDDYPPPDGERGKAFNSNKPRKPLTRQEQAEWDLARTRYLACEEGKPWPRKDHAAALLARGKSVSEAVATLRLRSRLRVIPGGPG